MVVRGTRRFRDRIPIAPAQPGEQSTGLLGDWYATLLRWRPAVAMFVNERTLLPVLLPAAPARSLTARLPDAAAQLMAALDVPAAWVEREVNQMAAARVAPTTNRSVVGVMTEFAFLADVYRADLPENLLGLAVRLTGTPCGPLRATHGFPDRALASLITAHPAS